VNSRFSKKIGQQPETHTKTPLNLGDLYERVARKRDEEFWHLKPLAGGGMADSAVSALEHLAKTVLYRTDVQLSNTGWTPAPHFRALKASRFRY